MKKTIQDVLRMKAKADDKAAELRQRKQQEDQEAAARKAQAKSERS